MTIGKWLKYSSVAVLIGSPLLIFGAWKTHTDPVRKSLENSLIYDQQLVQRVGGIQALELRKATYVQPGILHSGERTAGYNLYDYSVRGELSSAFIRVRVVESEQAQLDSVGYSIEYQR
jgi:hypothetical protein